MELAMKYIDFLPMWGVFLLTLLVLFGSTELGFRAGFRRRRLSSDSEYKGQASIIMGAALGMLGFMLAFTFGMSGNIHGNKKATALQEANAIGTAYLRAQMVPGPESTDVQNLLREYVDVRINATSEAGHVQAALQRSGEILDEVWEKSAQLARERPQSIAVGLYIDSVNEVIDLNSVRITATLYNRIPSSIVLTLYFVAVLTMVMMGYQAGLGGVQAHVPRLALIFAFSSLMLLIIDLDRPFRSLIQVNQHAMLDLQKSMR